MPVTRRAALVGISLLSMPVAWASGRSQEFIELSGANINLRNGGDAARADWLRYKLVEVNGPTGGYILAAGHGDQRGYLGTINALTGPALGGLLAQADIASCADIPTFGELSGSGTVEGRSVRLRAQLGAGSRTLPAHHHDAGRTYDKQIVLFRDDTAALEVQLSCADAQGYTSGYFYRPAEDANDRPHEAYFQQNERSGLSRVDFYMSHEPSGEHYAFRFESDGQDRVQIWNIRSMVKGRDSSGFAAVYSPSTGSALTGFLLGAHDPDDAMSLRSSDQSCVDLKSGDGAPDCAGMSINDPGETADVGNGKQPFNIAGLTRLQLRKDRPVRMREVRSIPSGKDAAVEDDAGHAGQDAGL